MIQCITYGRGEQNGLNHNSKRAIICVREGRAVCPVCGRRTNVRLLPETRLRSYPLYCKLCRAETVVDYDGT